MKRALLLFTFLPIFLLNALPVFATHSPFDSCSINIYPQPIAGNHTYFVTFTNNTSGTIGSIINNYYDGSSPQGVVSFSNLSSGSGWQFSNYGVNIESLTLAPSQAVTYTIQLNISSFGGMDIAASSLGSDIGSHDLCDGHRSPSTITYNDLSITTPTPTNIPSPTPTLATLPVPLLKQTSEPWQSEVYDTAQIWNPENPTINRWGCAMTSAAMVFNYHGLHLLPDGSQLNPGTLNSWLKSQPDGYIREGWLNWIALSRLSKIAKNINGVSFDALEYKRVHGANKIQLTNDINNGIPAILEEPGHFIVGKGIIGDTFAINDPFYDRETLNDGYSNSFISMGRYVPSHTDLSYILVVADPDVTIKLFDDTGVELAASFIQQPIVDPLNTTNQNEAVSMLYAPQPPTGNYQILISENTDKTSDITTYLYDNDGDVSIENNTALGNASYDISFDKNNSDNSTFKKTVSFMITLEDIKKLRELELLHFSTAISTTALVKNAEHLHNKGKDKQAKNLINAAMGLIQKTPKRFLDPVAKEILLYDFNELKGMLSN